MTIHLDIKFDNLLTEARFSYLEKDYIKALALVSAVQTIIAERQAAEDKANGRAAANRVD